MSRNQPGAREKELRAMREARYAEDKKQAKAPKVCTIDHSAEHAIPKELCQICTPPVRNNAPASAVAVLPQRDHRIPKGMSDAEGAEMLARRAEEKKAKGRDRIARMKAVMAEKEAAKVAKANEKRQEKGLELIEANESERKVDMKKRKGKAKETKGKANGNGHARKGSKAAKIEALLLRPDGCSNKEVLKATGWPTISMPAIAKSLGLKLRKQKTDDGLRYYGSR